MDRLIFDELLGLGRPMTTATVARPRPGRVGAPVRGNHQFEDSVVVAFAGAVPYSYGYGSPVV